MSNEQVVEGVKRARGDWALASEGGLILEGKKITGGEQRHYMQFFLSMFTVDSCFVCLSEPSSSVSNVTNMLRLRALRI